MEMWENQLSFLAPCQCLTLAGISSGSVRGMVMPAGPASRLEGHIADEQRHILIRQHHR